MFYIGMSKGTYVDPSDYDSRSYRKEFDNVNVKLPSCDRIHSTNNDSLWCVVAVLADLI